MRWFWTAIALLAAAGVWFLVAPRAVTPPGAAIDAIADSTPEPTQAPTTKVTSNNTSSNTSGTTPVSYTHLTLPTILRV